MVSFLSMEAVRTAPVTRLSSTPRTGQKARAVDAGQVVAVREGDAAPRCRPFRDLRGTSGRLCGSEHSVRISAWNVRPEQRSRVLRVPNELQCVPMLDRLTLGVHTIDIDASDAGIVRIIGEQIQEVQVGPDVVAERNDLVNHDARAESFASDITEELTECARPDG